MEWVWSFLFGLCLIYALTSTNNNKKIVPQYWFFPSDILIEKSTHSQIKYNNQNWKSKHIQKSSKKLRI